MSLTVDLSTLSNWNSISSGSHTLTIVAKAQGYRDSNPSTGVSFTKAASGLTLSYDWDVDGYVSSDSVNASTTISASGGVYVSSSTITVTASNGSDYTFSAIGNIQGSPSITSNSCTVELSNSGVYVDTDGRITISCTSGSQTIIITFEWTGWSCLTGDTLVTLADGSDKRLDQIEVGDYVLSYDWKTLEKMARKVILTDKDAHKTHTEYDVWTFDNGAVVKTVHRHEFYNAEAKRFKYMDEWQIGEHTLAIDGMLTALVAHEVVTEEVEHFKITLDGSTNYFANGLLTGDRYCPKNISFEGVI